MQDNRRTLMLICPRYLTVIRFTETSSIEARVGMCQYVEIEQRRPNSKTPGSHMGRHFTFPDRTSYRLSWRMMLATSSSFAWKVRILSETSVSLLPIAYKPFAIQLGFVFPHSRVLSVRRCVLYETTHVRLHWTGSFNNPVTLISPTVNYTWRYQLGKAFQY
jgi:hypothetical protein